MPSLARAQQKKVLTAASGTCTTTSCLTVTVDPTQGGATLTISANASANTIQFEASGDGGTTVVAISATPSNSSTAVTSTTSTGTWQINTSGYTNLYLRMSSLVSGTTTVSIVQGTPSARGGSGGGGGGITGTGASPQVAFWTSPTAISGDSHMTWDNTHHWLSLNDPAPPGICCGSAVIVNLPTPGTGAFTATIPATAAGGTSGFFGISQATVGNAGNILPVAIGQGTPPAYSDLATTAGFEADGSLFMEPILDTPNPILQVIHAVGVTTRDYFGIFNNPDQAVGHEFVRVNFANQWIHNEGTTGTPVGNLNVMGNPITSFADTEAALLFAEVETNFPISGFTAIPIAVKNKTAPANSYMGWTAFDNGTFNFIMTDDQITYDSLSFNTGGDRALEYAGGLIRADNGFQGTTYTTATNCKANGTAANPSVVACGSAAAGMFSCATAATTGTCQVNTSAVTANSEVLVIQTMADGGAGQLNVTCNTGSDLPASAPLLRAKSTGASFTINVGTISVNPACFEYNIVN